MTGSSSPGDSGDTGSWKEEPAPSSNLPSTVWSPAEQGGRDDTAVADPPEAEAEAGPPACKPPDAPLAFEQHYIDTTRAGGEPIVETHPDGTVLWGSHAGTTHFYAPAATEGDSTPFLRNYEGQTYQGSESCWQSQQP